MASACKSNVKDVISANNVDIYKIVYKMLIPGHNVLPHNVMQTNFGTSWGFSSKNHVQTARESHDSNMVFVFWPLLLVDLTMTSNSYMYRYLCKKNNIYLHNYTFIRSYCSDMEEKSTYVVWNWTYAVISPQLSRSAYNSKFSTSSPVQGAVTWP